MLIPIRSRSRKNWGELKISAGTTKEDMKKGEAVLKEQIKKSKRKTPTISCAPCINI
jgi:hypothetical protein